jgi:hypothetical protein
MKGLLKINLTVCQILEARLDDPLCLVQNITILDSIDTCLLHQQINDMLTICVRDTVYNPATRKKGVVFLQIHPEQPRLGPFPHCLISL